MTTEFSLQLDESTIQGNESLLLTFVRFSKDGSMCQELLFARLLETDTKGETVYRAVEDYLQKKKHSTYKHHLMAPVHDWSPPWISKLFEKICSEGPHSLLCDPSTTLSGKEFEWEATWILIDCDNCSQPNQSECSQFSTVPSGVYWKLRRFSMPASPYRS